MARKRVRDAEEAAAKRFEANQLFTPSAPIAVAELFAGRQRQAAKIVDAIAERGRHVIMFGERGVGKSSMAQIIPFFIPRTPQTVRHIRVQAFPADTFSTVAKRIFHKIHFEADFGEGKNAYNVAEFYPGEVTIDNFLVEIAAFRATEIPIIIIDEFNEIEDRESAVQLANAVKALSDDGINATVIIVGVANSVLDLIGKHESTERCLEQVSMPRMPPDERREVLETRLKLLEMSIDGDAKWTIINLSKGLPAYVHSLGRNSVFKALDAGSLHITLAEVNKAMDSVIESSQQSLKDAYEKATRSNHAKAQFHHVVTACALAPSDEAGYFTPAGLRGPFSRVVGRAREISNFQDTLKGFAETRGCILERSGEARTYRYRFASPAMQPYAIMRGIQLGLVDEGVKQALSSSEQGDLFAND